MNKHFGTFSPCIPFHYVKHTVKEQSKSSTKMEKQMNNISHISTAISLKSLLIFLGFYFMLFGLTVICTYSVLIFLSGISIQIMVTSSIVSIALILAILWMFWKVLIS